MQISHKKSKGQWRTCLKWLSEFVIKSVMVTNIVLYQCFGSGTEHDYVHPATPIVVIPTCINSLQWNRSKLCSSNGRDREMQRFCSWAEENLRGREGAISKSCFHCPRHAQQQRLKAVTATILHSYPFEPQWRTWLQRKYESRIHYSHHSSLVRYHVSLQKINKWSFSLKVPNSSTSEPSDMRILLPLLLNFFSAFKFKVQCTVWVWWCSLVAYIQIMYQYTIEKG